MLTFFTNKFKNLINFFQNDYWSIKNHEKRKNQILNLWKQLFHLSDKKLSLKTNEFIKRFRNDETLESMMNEVYAVACEVIKRVTGLVLHDVQIIGSIVLHFGDIAEMKTGEGKTLTSILPAYLNSISGKSVFIVTVNEYLVNRDCKENSKIFNFVNVSVGKILNKMNYQEKQENYLRSIVYGTNSEFGFDYLRDNMNHIGQPKLQKDFYYVIIDEIDSVLIDEGRTPLIISGQPKNRANLYQRVDKFVKNLKSSDFKIDSESKRCFLQRPGILKSNQYFGIKNLFDIENSELFHFISNSLQANYILKKNIDYLVKNRKVLLIDQFTGRITPDRTLSEGLHQSLEAKENCSIQEETSVLATITYQNYFRLFDKIAGMTGTAKSEEEEFMKLYNMHVLAIDTDQPVIRIDDDDLFFYDKKRKYLKLTKDVQEIHDRQQPILIGTCSVQTSEEITIIFRKFGLKFRVLNAKQHEQEAKLIASAGNHDSITIATNMAGRGTDIKLDEIAKKKGGLAVLGVERNESRRIDLQLQGRCGRQGEPGYSAFYVSLDDDLFLRFGNSYLKKTFKRFQEDVLKSRMLSKGIKKAQKKISNQNYDQRKNLLEYDNVISQQRRVFYKQRDFLINDSDLNSYLKNLFAIFLQESWKKFFPERWEVSQKELFDFLLQLQESCLFSSTIKEKLQHETWTYLEIITLLTNEIIEKWNQELLHCYENTSLIVKQNILEKMDYAWVHHLDEIFRIKASSFLHGYAQKNPLQAFIEEAESMFGFLKNQIIFQSVPSVFEILKKNRSH